MHPGGSRGIGGRVGGDTLNYLLDTSICIAYLNGTDDNLRDYLLSIDPQQLNLCSVVKAELLFGARKSARVAENLTRLQQFFQPFRNFYFDDAAAGHYGQLRATLEREGRLVGTNDMLIAAIALAQDVTLMTRNIREFSRIAGLKVVQV